MKIKLHKRFRGLLSVFVAVMLLVGVMPTQVWQGMETKAAVVCTVYFSKNMGSGDFDKYNVGIYAWVTENGSDRILTAVSKVDSSNASDTHLWHDENVKLMDYVADGFSQTGFYVHKFEFTEMPTGIIFVNNGFWNDGQTVDILSNDIHDDYLYYCKGTEGGNRKVQSFPYEDLTYGALTINQCNMGKDVNVIVDNSETFVPKNERHYVKATMYDYFSDYELLNGRTRTGGNGADVVNRGITVPYGTAWEDPCRRMQHPTFDTQLSDYYRQQNAATHPLYFGDIHDEGGGYYFSTYNDNQWGLYYNPSSGQSGNQTYRQLYHDNNSTRRSGLNVTNQDSSAFAAATGLYADTLMTAYNESYSNTTNAARLKLMDGKDAKWFDSTWLENGLGTSSNKKSIGASYDVDFPFWTINMQRKIGSQIYRACDYYYINSEKKEHALRMYKSNGKYYLKETGQGIYNYSGNDYNILHENSSAALTSTYGFFPFNSKQDFYTSGTWGDSGKSQDINKDLGGIMDPPLRLDRTNYCFGTYMVIPFKLMNNKGNVGGTDDADDPPITFTFSGDDDLLVYVDGNLVLDIGGNHGKVQGEINFKEKKSWVSNVKNSTGTDASGITWRDPNSNISDERNLVNPNLKTGLQVMTSTTANASSCEKSLTGIKMVSDSSKNIYDAGEHVMEIFYVERGLFDSNMEIMYNLPVIYNRTVEVEKQVESTLNPDMKSATNGSNIATNLNNLQFPIQMEISEGNTSSFTNPATPNTYTLNTTSNTSFISNNQMLLTDDDVGSYTKELYQTTYLKIQELGTENLRYNGSALSGKTVSSLFDTRWQYYNVSGGSVTAIGNNSTGPAQDTENTGYFRWLGTTTSPSRVKFTNTLKTGTLKINKTINGTAPNENKTFVFTVTLNNVGGIGLEENTFTGADGTNGGDKIEFTVNVPISLGQTTNFLEIPGIPINTEYTVEETDTQGYTSSGIQTGTIETTGTNNAGITNTPPSSKFKIRVQSYFTQNNSAQVNGVPSSVKLKLQKSIDGGSNWEVVESDITISPVQTDDTNGRKYFELLLNENFEYNTNHKYRILEYDSGGTNTISSGGYDGVFTALVDEFTNNSDTKKANRAVSEAVSEEIGGNQTPVLTLSLLNAGTVPIALKIQKVWGTTTVYPTSVKFTVERSTDGSHWENVSHANIVGFDGSVSYDANGKLVLTSANEKIITSGGATITLWGAYIFDTSNVDVDSGGNIYQYKITEYTSSDVQVGDGSVFYFTTGSGDNAETTMFSVSYHPAAFAPGYLNSYVSQTEAKADYLADISTYESTYGDSTNNTMRVLPLSIINSPVPDPDAPATGGRGGYVPIAGGFIAILLAGAGYFIYKKRIFA